MEHIAVVAGFVALLTLGDIAPHDTITAARHQAIAATAVLVVAVAIITAFAFIEPPVATGLKATFAVAAIADFIIAVIAAFEADAGDAITTTGLATIVGAIIGIGLVAVITTFTGIESSVAANLSLAFLVAAIAVDRAAVIAGLKTLLLWEKISA